MIVLFGLAVVGAIVYALYALFGWVFSNVGTLGLIVGGICGCGAFGTLLYWLAYGKKGWKIQREGGHKFFLPIVVSSALAGLWAMQAFSWAQTGFSITDWFGALLVVGGAALYILWFLIVRARVDRWQWVLYGDARFAPEEKPVKKTKRRTIRMGWHKFLANGALYVGAAVCIYAGVALIMASMGRNIGFGWASAELGALLDARIVNTTTIDAVTGLAVPAVADASNVYLIGGIVFAALGVVIAFTGVMLAKHKSVGPTLLSVVQILACILPLGFFFWVYGVSNFDAIPYTSALVMLVMLIMNREYYEKRAAIFDK